MDTTFKDELIFNHPFEKAYIKSLRVKSRKEKILRLFKTENPSK